MDRKEFDKQVGRKIKSLRVLMDISQRDLAERLDCSFQQIQKYEVGKNIVCPHKIKKLTEIFGVDANYFFDPPSKLDNISLLTKKQKKIVSYIVKCFMENKNVSE